MSEKVYVLNVYNTMTGQYELIHVTDEAPHQHEAPHSRELELHQR